VKFQNIAAFDYLTVKT